MSFPMESLHYRRWNVILKGATYCITAHFRQKWDPGPGLELPIYFNIARRPVATTSAKPYKLANINTTNIIHGTCDALLARPNVH